MGLWGYLGSMALTSETKKTMHPVGRSMAEANSNNLEQCYEQQTYAEIGCL